MANRPTPTQLKLLAGNPGKRPINGAEPRPSSGELACPDWLPPIAQDEWNRVVPILAACGLATAADEAAIVSYCIVYAEVRDAVERGRFPTHSSLAALRHACVELGLTPSQRSRIAVSKPSDDDRAESYFSAAA